ncbi:GDSL-like Lipase/Acylhydrolase family protein [Actinidia rufa]|uniref:GDSL-like Lipase/Acylhydrolase family protein n=1 Tax=Actinidia rufa TaxID=165716 RepID=A0A7J0E1U5_9ERIC|nr:GDSL-like Lipase/Acylhydrolase family protein [Actinidia rufa]
MGFPITTLVSIFLAVATLVVSVAHGDPLVPMLCIFGDSVVDVGNNNNLNTLIKSNFPPYGRDFVTHKPTGRFCNGKLATDFTAEYLGFTSYPPAYLSQDAKGKSLLTGANFASAGSGYYERTAQIYRAITLTQQVAYYKEYQDTVVKMVGKDRANAMFSGGIHLLSAGSSDFIQNYYINPVLNRAYSPDQFSDILMGSFSTFVQLVTESVWVGGEEDWSDNPTTNWMFASNHHAIWGGSNQCVGKLNQDAISFNNKLNTTSQVLQNKLPGLKLVVFDIYHPLLDMVIKPTDQGFFEARKACCGTGTIETSLLCNARSVGTCSNATQYVYWDGYHPSEAANQVIAQDLLEQGFSLSREDCTRYLIQLKQSSSFPLLSSINTYEIDGYFWLQ